MPETPTLPACPHCVDPVLPSDAATWINGDRRGGHVECVVRMVVGSVGHQQGRCECHGGHDDSEDGLSARDAARAAYAYFHEHLAVRHGDACRPSPPAPPAPTATAMPELAAGDVVQITPAFDAVFGGCFMVVEKVTAEGAAEGYVMVPTPPRVGPAYVTCAAHQMKRIGRAMWLDTF